LYTHTQRQMRVALVGVSMTCKSLETAVGSHRGAGEGRAEKSHGPTPPKPLSTYTLRVSISSFPLFPCCLLWHGGYWTAARRRLDRLERCDTTYTQRENAYNTRHAPLGLLDGRRAVGGGQGGLLQVGQRQRLVLLLLLLRGGGRRRRRRRRHCSVGVGGGRSLSRGRRWEGVSEGAKAVCGCSRTWTVCVGVCVGTRRGVVSNWNGFFGLSVRRMSVRAHTDHQPPHHHHSPSQHHRCCWPSLGFFGC
jgi:hypothetical protein